MWPARQLGSSMIQKEGSYMAENTNLCNDEWEVSKSHKILALFLACFSDHGLTREKNPTDHWKDEECNI